MSKRRLCAELPVKSRQRLVYLSLVVVFLFCLLLIQFYRIQVVEGEKWSKKAATQHQICVVQPYKRGVFYSNTSLKEGHPDSLVPFVVNVPKFHLYADVVSLGSDACKKNVIDQLSLCFQMNQKEKEHLALQLSKKSRSRKLILWMSEQQKLQIEQWWFPFAKQHRLPRNSLFFLQDFKRSYPYGKMLGQVLHTIREEKDPKTHEEIPTGGLELALNAYLKGKEGKKMLLRSPKNPLDIERVIAEPEDGADVFLTLNHHIQAIAEEEIEKAVKKAEAKGGWALMMDPSTGEILAWAQYPWFDPSTYRTFFNQPSLQDFTKIKGIIDPFEPGSTMKPITMAICLLANEELKKRGKPPLFSPGEKINTSNGYFPGRSSPVKDVRRHSYLNMYMALQKSSNIYMARIIERVIQQLGDAWYRNCLQEIFGFGTKTGVELTCECPGMLPSPGKKHANGALQWSKPTPFSLSFGYNLLTSSLQIVRAYAILAGGGYEVQPTLIKKIVRTDRQGHQTIVVDKEQEREQKKRVRLLPPSVVSEVVKGMMYVTKQGGGASKADILGYTEAGKTSTTEKLKGGSFSKKDHISSFVGFCPVKDPRFVLMIVIDEPACKIIPGVGKNQYGGNCAAPAFAEIGRKTLEYLGVQPDDPSKAVWQKEAEELNQLYRSWNGT